MACETGKSGLASSRCRHWRECLAEGERDSPNATCTPRKLLLDVDEDGEEYHSPECCQEGYRGPLVSSQAICRCLCFLHPSWLTDCL